MHNQPQENPRPLKPGANSMEHHGAAETEVRIVVWIMVYPMLIRCLSWFILCLSWFILYLSWFILCLSWFIHGLSYTQLGLLPTLSDISGETDFWKSIQGRKKSRVPHGQQSFYYPKISQVQLIIVLGHMDSSDSRSNWTENTRRYPDESKSRNYRKWYPLVNVYITDGKITIFNGKTHYKWPCSIAFCMLVYQRVNGPCSTPKEQIRRRRWLSSRLSGLSGLPCLASPGLGVENDRSGEWVYNGI